MTLGLDGGRRERSMQRLKLDPLTPRAGAMISARAPSIDAYQFRFRKWRTHFVFALDSMFIEIIGPPQRLFSVRYQQRGSSSCPTPSASRRPE